MQLYSIKGGNKEDLVAGKYNIGVGISLGNKWFTVENIVSLVQWSLQYTKDYVIVYVADSIHAINLEVRNGISSDKAKAKAQSMGDVILSQSKEALSKVLNKEVLDRIHFVKWDEIVDGGYKTKLVYLYEKYNHDNDFREVIVSIVRNGVARENRTFSDKEISRLGEYLIEELPEVLCRVPMRYLSCDAYAYPYSGDLVDLIEQIQQGKRFVEIRDKVMDTSPKVFLEVR